MDKLLENVLPHTLLLCGEKRTDASDLKCLILFPSLRVNRLTIHM
jgi:hypothetical protein